MAGKIITAVDFGTTYSAIGYAYYEHGAKPTDIDLIIVDRGWPGQGRRRSPKIPSVYKLDGDDFSYGFKVASDPDRVSFPKLFLDPEQLKKAQHLVKVHMAAERPSDDALMDGVTRYLRALREFAAQHMLKKWSREFVESKPREYILSVPAIWSDPAKNKTLECAFNAGYGDRSDPSSIRLVSEPEAAAIYAIMTLPDCTLKTNDVFLVCDAGGGTVDLTTYRITSLYPSLRVEETAIGHGGLCGSVALNVHFSAFLEKKLANLEAKDISELQIQFNDVIKPAFDGENKEYSVSVPTRIPENINQGVQDGRLVMTVEDLEGIFDPVVEHTLILIQQHIDENKAVFYGPKLSILLVGGFGSSKYLKKKVEQKFDSSAVMQPPDAWSAVIRGAILKAVVRKRKIRAFYGIKIWEVWTKEKHEIGPLAQFARTHKVYDEYEQLWRCTNRVQWYVKKGEVFDEAKTVAFPFYKNVGIHHSLEFEIDLWAYTQGREGGDGPPFLDGDCRRIAVMKPDLSWVPRQTLQRKSSPRGEFYKVEFEIVMSFDTMISFQLKYNGQTQKQVQVEYVEFEDGAVLRS